MELDDVCTGGIFFNQGGALQSLPNHLKNMVLWNFEGVSYRNDFVKSFRPNNETAYAKFITPIISGLKGFTMSNQANQYQVNESPGTHVDEESLYEAQLKYRLGTLPSWISNETTNPFYPIFQYEDFGTENRGYSVYVVTNPDNQEEAQIWKRVNDIPDAADSNNLFTETRPENRIPVSGERDQKALAIVGTASSKNYKMEAWAVMQTVDLSVANQFLNADDAFKFVSFWTEQRFANGNISNLEVYVSTDYTNDVGAADWTNVTSNLNQIATSGQNPQTYIESVLDISAYTSNTFTLAFKYESDNSAHSQTNRNGTFYVSDVKYFTSSSSLSTKIYRRDNIAKVYPNPFSSTIEIRNLQGKFEKAILYDSLGRIVTSTDINGLQKTTLNTSLNNRITYGIYFLKLIGNNVTEDFKLIKK